MGKVKRSAIVIPILLVAACSPVVAGPELPRPAVAAMTVPAPTTTVAPTTTTTLDPADVMAAECPTAFCLVYEVEPDATWSDGSPVTSEDFVSTYEAAMGLPQEARDPGYDLISGVDVIDKRRARVVFDQPYGPWQRLFSRLMPPEGTGSGPFRLVDWVPGDSIVVERVEDWWPEADPVSGAALGDVEEIEFVFLGDMSEMIDALESGEVDVVLGRPDTDSIETLSSMEEVDYSITPGRFWEHIEFHHEDPLLSQRWLREAIARAIDREAILDLTAQQFAPSTVGLGNTLFMTGDTAYESHYDVPYDPGSAERILVQNGCTRDGDDLYVCRGTPLSFIWAATSDDPARRQAFEVVAENLEAVGIEIVADFKTPSDFVSTDFILGGPDRWQLANFAWRASDDPSESVARYACGDTLLNVSRYCSQDVDDLMDRAGLVVDRDARNALYNEADRLYLDDLAVIPLYQKPELMAWTREMSGLVPNHSSSSDLWNVAAWSGKPSIVVAIPGEPSSLKPFTTTDDNANMVLATLMYGALGMAPSLDPLEVLVDSVEVVEG